MNMPEFKQRVAEALIAPHLANGKNVAKSDVTVPTAPLENGTVHIHVIVDYDFLNRQWPYLFMLRGIESRCTTVCTDFHQPFHMNFFQEHHGREVRTGYMRAIIDAALQSAADFPLQHWKHLQGIALRHLKLPSPSTKWCYKKKRRFWRFQRRHWHHLSLLFRQQPFMICTPSTPCTNYLPIHYFEALYREKHLVKNHITRLHIYDMYKYF